MCNIVYLLLPFSCFGAERSVTKPLTLAFEAREGEYVSHSPGYSVSVTPGGALVHLPGHALRMWLAGAAPGATLEPLDRMPGRTNYFLGRNVRRSYELYGRVRARAVYRGIDMVFRGNQERLEYDFEIAAGRDPGRIEVSFEGADEIRIDPGGDLILRAGAFEIHQPTPAAFQVVAGRRTPVSVAYRLDASHGVRFRLGRYDHRRALVIDPQLVFANYFGGSGSSSAADVALDAQGNIYVAGQTNSADLQVRNAVQNHAGAAALLSSSDGGQTWTKTLIPYVTAIPYVPESLFVSPADSRVLAGGATQSDAFVTKWSPDGSQVLYSTYLGGSQNDFATGIAVDSSGSVYVTGTTQSQDFPVSRNAFQKTLAGKGNNAFIVKLSPDGSQLIYSTLLGGGSEMTSRIAVDRTGEAVVAGGTNSGTSFPVTPGAFQSKPVNAICTLPSYEVETSGTAFVSKLSADGGSLVFSTLLGGTCWTMAQAVAIDPNGNTWAAGWTDSEDFPVTKDAWQTRFGGSVYDGFLARFSESGGLAYATYVGGPGFDIVTGLTFDQKGNIYLTGTTGGLSQPASPGAFESQVGTTCSIFYIGPAVYQAVGNAFVLKLDPAAHTTLGLTYMGSRCLFPSDIAVDASGAPWIGGGLGNGSTPRMVTPLEIGIGNGFVSKFSADFTQLLFSTYFDSVAGIALDSAGKAHVAGGGPIDYVLETGQAYLAKMDATAPTAVSLDSVMNAADAGSPSSGQGIAPGEVLRLLGKNMGPEKTTPGIVNGGVLASTVAGVQVSFDGVAVPLLSVGWGEIELVAPFGLAGKTATSIQVQYNGGSSNPVRVGVSATALQVLNVLNDDFTPNSASNPARAGSVVTLYVGGAGQTVPPSQDGQINGFPPAAPWSPFQIQWFGSNSPVDLPVVFAGAAEGLAAGILQINFVAPQQSLTNVSLRMGNGFARFNVSVK